LYYIVKIYNYNLVALRFLVRIVNTPTHKRICRRIPVRELFV